MTSNPWSITLGGLVRLLAMCRMSVRRGAHSGEPENVPSTTFSGVRLDIILMVTRSASLLNLSCFDYIRTH